MKNFLQSSKLQSGVIRKNIRVQQKTAEINLYEPAVTAQFPAVVQLADLNGQNGFKVDGEGRLSESGSAVSGAGDFNGDGYDDLLISAIDPISFKGDYYVIFGSHDLEKQNVFNLTSVDGINGFKIYNVLLPHFGRHSCLRGSKH